MASEKRQHILLAAQKLFQEKGLGMATMDDIAKSAGMGKSSTYYYFKSKEEIFDAVLETEINEVILETIRQMSQRLVLADKLVAFAMVKFAMSRKRKSLYQAMEAGMDAEALSRYESLKKTIHLRYLQKEKVLLQQAFIIAANQKEIPGLDPPELDESIFIFLSALRGMNREFNLYGAAEEAERILPAFCRLFLAGMQ